MWCRTILTAVAISYVLCMLLLSGLQKEDLDANTLEKLSRHNVNMDDMNNEQWREKCLLDSNNQYFDANGTENPVTTEVQTEAIEIYSTDPRVDNDVNVGGSRLITQDEDDSNKSKRSFGQHSVLAQNIPPVPSVPTLSEILNKDEKINYFDNLDNITKVEENNGLKLEYNKQNQPDVKSVMNFWKKLTHFTKTVVTKLPTTPELPNISAKSTVTTKVKIENHNNGYVHSREMEYISRILAEYIASQTVPTTTQSISSSKVYTKFEPRKYGVTPKKPPINKELIFTSKYVEQLLNNQNNDSNKMNNFTQDANKINYNSLLGETESIPFKVIYDSTQMIKTIQETPNSHILSYETNREANHTKKDYSRRLLSRLLRMNKEYINNGEPTLYTEFTTKSIDLLTNQNNEHQHKMGTFDQYHLFNHLNDENNTKNNFDQNQNIITNNDEFKSASVEVETWKPVRSYTTLNNQSKDLPKDKEQNRQMRKFRLYDHFKAAPYNIANVKKKKTVKSNTFNDTITNQSQQTHFKNRIKVKNFQPILPSIKNSRLNKKFRIANNQLMSERTESGEFDNVQSPYDGDQFKPLPAAAESGRNRLSKINYYEFNADPVITKNIKQHSKELNDDQFRNTVPEIKEIGRTKNSFNKIIKRKNNYERDKEQRIPDNEKDSEGNQNFGMNMYEPHTLSDNIINEIAEKVKQIVLKDIGKEVITSTRSSFSSVTTSVPTTVSSSTTTAAPTTVTSSSTTTATPTTITTTTTVAPSTTTSTAITTSTTTLEMHKDITEANLVMKKLIEIFEKLQLIKETTTLTSDVPQNTTNIIYSTTKLPKLPIQKYPFNPYMKSSPAFKPIQVSFNDPRMVPVPVNPLQNQGAQFVPLLNMPQPKDYHARAITIQTNEDEIAPLAIEVSQPLKLINQHIVVTTKRSIDKLREEPARLNKKISEENFRNPTVAKNHREKLKLETDYTKNLEPADNPKRHEFRDRYTYKSKFIKSREKPWFNHEYNEKVHRIEGSNHPAGSRFPDTLHYPGSESHLGRLKGSSNPDSLSYAGELKQPDLIEPVSHQSRINRINGIRQTGSYGHSNSDHRPRYEATKFHEKLERIENWPRSSWKDFKPMSTDSSCDEISARQQMPLVKVKQRTRFDDTHFMNFLKSQQKVTDMLERILANNIKTSGPQSVETP